MTASTNIRYLGWSNILIQSEAGDLVFDPFFRRLAGAQWASLADYAHVKVICVTHGHAEHYLDTPRVAKATGAAVVSSPQVCDHLHGRYGVPEKQLLRVEPGQKVKVGGFSITPFSWYHRKISYLRFFLGDFFTGLYFSSINLLRCPVVTPYYGYMVEAPDGLRLMNCSEGINPLYPAEEARQLAQAFKPQVLAAGCQLSYEADVARVVEAVGPQVFIAYHPHERIFARMNIQSSAAEVFDQKVREVLPDVTILRPEVLSTVQVAAR